ncbi:hypothetical protein CEJ87_15620 [Caldifermentibacillus hisashii]|nr:hypothetical protein CEJ87_15620 [Caldifermentibacillus hisashii]
MHISFLILHQKSCPQYAFLSFALNELEIIPAPSVVALPQSQFVQKVPVPIKVKKNLAYRQ